MTGKKAMNKNSTGVNSTPLDHPQTSFSTPRYMKTGPEVSNCTPVDRFFRFYRRRLYTTPTYATPYHFSLGFMQPLNSAFTHGGPKSPYATKPETLPAPWQKATLWPAPLAAPHSAGIAMKGPNYGGRIGMPTKAPPAP